MGIDMRGMQDMLNGGESGDTLYGTVLLLRQEIAKLREQLAAAEARLEFRDKPDSPFCDSCALWENMAWEMKQRAEAAEAKLKAASEPIMAICIEGCVVIGASRMRMNGLGWVNLEKPLYADPIPPADVQEIASDSDCRESDGCPTEKSVLQRCWRESQERIAELERKLSEWKSAAIEREKLCIKVESSMPDILASIAQAREEGRKEAVPDAINAAPNEATPEEAQAFVRGFNSCREAMLAAAPKP